MKRRYIKLILSLLSGSITCMLIPSINQAMQGGQEQEPALICHTTNGQRIPIIEQQLDAPFKIIQEDRETIIAFDSWLLKGVPRAVILFEQSRYCVELRASADPRTKESRASSSRTKLSEYEKDCLAISLLREQELITYRQFYEIVNFYTEWKDVKREEHSNPKRVKNLFNCYKNYQPMAPSTTSRFKRRVN